MGSMFNWHSAPTLGAMLLFWLLAAYVLTRSPRSPISLTAVGAQLATGVYLLGQGLAANAGRFDQWYPWARTGQAGAVLAPLLWYWLTVLLLQEVPGGPARGFARRVGVPCGIALALVASALLTAVYAGDSVLDWSQAHPGADLIYAPFSAPTGPAYWIFVA